MKTLRKQKPMRTKKQLRDSSNWEQVEVGGEFGMPIKIIVRCPICLEFKNDYEVKGTEGKEIDGSK